MGYRGKSSSQTICYRVLEASVSEVREEDLASMSNNLPISNLDKYSLTEMHRLHQVLTLAELI